MSVPAQRLRARTTDEIADEALRNAVVDLSRPGSWRGIARGLAWRLVSTGERDPRTIERLADQAEAILASLIEDALWTLEQRALRTFNEYLEARPGDQEAALAAARLDANEESLPLVLSACEIVLDTLRGTSKRAA